MATAVGNSISGLYNDSEYVYQICFTSGTFIPDFTGTVDFLIVAGGGGGGMDMGGGGGGGAVYESFFTVTAGTSYPIVVGAGGQGAPSGGHGNTDFHQFTISAQQGGASSAFGNTCYGGGYGGSSYWSYTPDNGYGQGGGNVGSGGGTSGYGNTDPATRAGGAAGTGGVGLRNAGGSGYRSSGYYSGSGGGAGGAGNGGSAAVNNSGSAYMSTIIEGYELPFGEGGAASGYTVLGGSSYFGAAGGGAPNGEVYQNFGSGTGAGFAQGTALGYGASGFKKFMGTHAEPGSAGTVSTWSGGKGGNAARYSGSGGGGGGHYNRGNKGGDGGSGVVILKYLRSLGKSTFSPTNTNNISSRQETKHSLNRGILFHIDPNHPKPHEIAHVLLVAGGGSGGLDMGGGGGGGGVISYTNYPINFYNDELEITLGAGGVGSGTYNANPPPGGNGGDTTLKNNTSGGDFLRAVGGGGGGSGHYTEITGDGRGTYGGSAGGDAPKWGQYQKQNVGTKGHPHQGNSGGAAGYNGNGSYESGGGGGARAGGEPGAGGNDTSGDGGRGFPMTTYTWNGFGNFALAGGGGGGGYNTHGGDGFDGGGGGSTWTSGYNAGGTQHSLGSTTYADYVASQTGQSASNPTSGTQSTTAQTGGNGGARTGGGGGGGNHQAVGGNGGSGVSIMALQASGTPSFAGGHAGFTKTFGGGYAIHTHSSGTISWGGSFSGLPQRDIAGNFTQYTVSSSNMFPHTVSSSNPFYTSSSLAEIDTYMSNGTTLGVTRYPEDALSASNDSDPYPKHLYTGNHTTYLDTQHLSGTGSSAYRPGYVPNGFKAVGTSASTNADISAQWLSRINFGFTVEVWFRPSASGQSVLFNVNGTSTPNIICQYSHSSSPSGRYADLIISSNGYGSLTHRVYAARAARTTGNNIWNLSTYTWKHLVFRYDSERFSAANQHGLTLYGAEIFMDGLNVTDPWYGDYYGSSSLKYQGTGSVSTAGLLQFGGLTNTIISNGIGFSNLVGPGVFWLGNRSGGSSSMRGNMGSCKLWARPLSDEEIKQSYLSSYSKYHDNNYGSGISIRKSYALA